MKDLLFFPERRVNMYLLHFNNKSKPIGDDFDWTDDEKIEFIKYLFSIEENCILPEIDFCSCKKICIHDLEYYLQIPGQRAYDIFIVRIKVKNDLYTAVTDVSYDNAFKKTA